MDAVSQIDPFSVASMAVAVIAAISALSSAVVAYMVYRKQTSPDVIAYLDADLDRLLLFFVVENVGSGVAYDVEIELSRDLPADDDVRPYIERGAIGKGIPVLVPGGKRVLYLCQTLGAVKELGDDEIDAAVRYRKSRAALRRTMIARFPLDVHSFHGVHVVSRKKKALDAINNIGRALEASSRADGRMASALEKMAGEQDK